MAALLCANDIQIVAPGSKFRHRPTIPERWPLDARLEEPSTVGLLVFAWSPVATLGLATTFEDLRRNAISIIVTSSRRYGVRIACQNGGRATTGRQHRDRVMSGSGACQHESDHPMRCRRCASRTVKSWPRQTILQQHQSARWSARG